MSNQTPTQVQRPWRTTLRTAVQIGIPLLIGLGVVVPEVVDIILEEAGAAVPDGLREVLLGIAAVCIAVSATITRIMAIPRVEELLQRYRLLGFLAAARPPARRRGSSTREPGDPVQPF